MVPCGMAGARGVFVIDDVIGTDALTRAVGWVSRINIQSRKKMRFIPLKYCGLWGRAGADRQTTV